MCLCGHALRLIGAVCPIFSPNSFPALSWVRDSLFCVPVCVWGSECTDWSHTRGWRVRQFVEPATGARADVWVSVWAGVCVSGESQPALEKDQKDRGIRGSLEVRADGVLRGWLLGSPLLSGIWIEPHFLLQNEQMFQCGQCHHWLRLLWSIPLCPLLASPQL